MAVAFAAVLWLLSPGVASAHAHLTQADPGPGSVIARTPAVASFLFDEPLNPTLTRVQIVDTAGHTVSARRGHLVSGHGGELWQLPMPHLRAGTYSVLWTSESATDGHVMSSFYTFRVSPPGASARVNAVVGSAAGAMSGMPANGSGTLLAIDNSAALIVLISWLGQVAQAMWLGALVVELAVLAPARRAGGSPEACLARLATRRSWFLGMSALIVVALSAVGQLVGLALEGTGGDWERALAPATLGGMLSSQNGQLMLVRFVVLGVAMLLAMKVRVPSFSASNVTAIERERSDLWLPEAAAIVAPWVMNPRRASPWVAASQWQPARLSLTCLAGLYMVLVALSGHAANVSPLWLSAGIDWLHLVCTAAWIGGIAVLAYGVVPVRRALRAEHRAPAILPLLDRFSPVAYVAVGVLTISGLFNATSHLHEPSMVAQTVYGHLLVVKTALVGVLLAMSGSHVRWLRPVIARAQKSVGLRSFNPDASSALATMYEGLATLAGRLRVEAGVGALVLLVTALMGQTLPTTAGAAAASSPTMAASSSSQSTRTAMGAGISAATGPADSSSTAGGATRPMITTAPAIVATMVRGDLRARLSIAPPTVGAMQVTLRLWERGRLITANDGAAIVHLYPAAQPRMRATVDLTAHDAAFTAQGSVVMMGRWHADVLVRTALVDQYRTLPFVFTVGPGARFLAPATPIRLRQMRHTMP